MTIAQRIDAAWDKPTRHMDWLGLESVLRTILETVPEDERDNPTLRLIDETLAAFTRRGYAFEVKQRADS